MYRWRPAFGQGRQLRLDTNSNPNNSNGYISRYCSRSLHYVAPPARGVHRSNIRELTASPSSINGRVSK